MADRLKGITIELDGDTTKLSNALKGVNKEIRDTIWLCCRTAATGRR